MKHIFLKKMLGLTMALVLMLSCANVALAWEPEWEHDEDLSAYKLCENFGDITLTLAVTDHASISDWDTNEFILWLEEVTNAHLQFELLP